MSLQVWGDRRRRTEIRSHLEDQDGEVQVFRYGKDVPTGNREGSRSRGDPLQGREDLSQNLPEPR